MRFHPIVVSDLLGKKEITADDINVVEFGRKRIEELKQANRSGSAKNMQTVVNSLIDYFRMEDIRITDIRAKMLLRYEAFLCKPRTQIRLDISLGGRKSGKSLDLQAMDCTTTCVTCGYFLTI